MDDNSNALLYYEMANNINPKYYYNLKPLVNIYLKMSSEKLNDALEAFFNLDPGNPTIYNDLEEVFYANNRIDVLASFYKSQYAKFPIDDKVLGNLDFYLAKIYADSDKELAKSCLQKARGHFKKVFEKDHYVFDAIDKFLKSLEN